MQEHLYTNQFEVRHRVFHQVVCPVVSVEAIALLQVLDELPPWDPSPGNRVCGKPWGWGSHDLCSRGLDGTLYPCTGTPSDRRPHTSWNGIFGE